MLLSEISKQTGQIIQSDNDCTGENTETTIANEVVSSSPASYRSISFLRDIDIYSMICTRTEKQMQSFESVYKRGKDFLKKCELCKTMCGLAYSYISYRKWRLQEISFDTDNIQCTE